MFVTLAMQTFMAMMDSIQLHWNTLKSRVLLESSKALMSSLYLWGKSRPDMSHSIHAAFIWDGNSEMERVRALMDRGVKSIVMAPRL